MKALWRDYDIDRAEKTDRRIWDVLAKCWPLGLRFRELLVQTGLDPRTLNRGLDRLIEARLVKKVVGVYPMPKHRVSDERPAYEPPVKKRPMTLLKRTPGYMLTVVVYPGHEEKRPTLAEMDAEFEKRRKAEGDKFDEDAFWKEQYKKSHSS